MRAFGANFSVFANYFSVHSYPFFSNHLSVCLKISLQKRKGIVLKLDKAQAQWVRQLVEDSTAKEREALQTKEQNLKMFASALIRFRRAKYDVRRAWSVYKKETGEGRKSAADRLHITAAEQNIIFAPAATENEREQSEDTTA